jgi:hypothetical protein
VTGEIILFRSRVEIANAEAAAELAALSPACVISPKPLLS